jgi:hypothetical protein
MTWPSITKALVSGIRADLQLQVGTKVPDNVETLLKFVRVARGPGTDDLITDAPLIDVECFSNEYSTAESLAETVRQWFHRLAGRSINGVLVDKVRTASGPEELDYRNPGTNRFVASYRLEYRQSS